MLYRFVFYAFKRGIRVSRLYTERSMFERHNIITGNTREHRGFPNGK